MTNRSPYYNFKSVGTLAILVVFMSAFTGNGDRYKPKENDSFISDEKEELNGVFSPIVLEF